MAWKMRNYLQAELWDNPPLQNAILYFKNTILPRPNWNEAGKQLNDFSGAGNNGQIHSGGALTLDGVNNEINVGDVGSVRSYSLLLELDSTSEDIIELNATDSLSASGGTLSLAGQSGTIYVNGVESSTITTAYAWVTVVLDAAVTADDVNIGKVGVAFGGFDVAGFHVYTDALTASEVLANYNNPQTPIANGLEVNYGFDELAGNTVFDKSGNGNNGTIVGATRVSGVKEGYQPALGGFNNYEETAPSGTISTSGTAVTGSGTAFTTDYSAGDVIGVAGGEFRIVDSVTDNTNLTVTQAFTVAYSGATQVKLALETGTNEVRIVGQEYNSPTDIFGNTMQNAYIPNALNFSGGYDGIFVDAGANIDTSGAFSFAGWVYFNTLNGNRIISNTPFSSGIEIYEFSNSMRFFSRDGSTSSTVDSAVSSINSGTWYSIALTRSLDGSQTNWYIGGKTTTPTLSGTANRDSGTPTNGSNNMTLAARSTNNDFNLDGYLIYPVMYTADLSAANTNTKLIVDAWNATRGDIPSV